MYKLEIKINQLYSIINNKFFIFSRYLQGSTNIFNDLLQTPFDVVSLILQFHSSILMFNYNIKLHFILILTFISL